MIAAPDDAELLRRFAREGAEEAFAELVRRYIGLVYHAALRQLGGDGHGAEDVTQAVFTRLARKAAGLCGHQTLAGWLHTTARYVANELIRAERRRRAREEAFAMHALDNDEPNAADWERLRPVLDEVVGELNDREREVVLLRFLSGLRLAQVGARLGLSDNAARMRLERALEKLRLRLARRGVTSTAGALALALAAQANAAVPAGLTGTVTSKAIAGGASAGAAAALGELFGFMSTMKLTGGVAALVVIAALGTGVHAVRARSAAEAMLLAETKAHAALTADAQAAERRALEAETDLTELRRQLAAAQSARAASETRPAAAGRAAEATNPSDPATAGDAFMGRHPAVKAALGDYARARVNFRFAELYQKLGLTPAQIAQFQELVARAGMGSRGSDGSNLQLLWRPARARGEGDSELRQLLGDEGMRWYQEIERLENSRITAVHVAGALWFSDTPLTPSQADQFVAVLERNRARPPSNMKTAGRVDWDAVIAAARGFLSEPQLAVLEGERARDRYHEAMNAPPSPRPAAAPTK